MPYNWPTSNIRMEKCIINSNKFRKRDKVSKFTSNVISSTKFFWKNICLPIRRMSFINFNTLVSQRFNKNKQRIINSMMMLSCGTEKIKWILDSFKKSLLTLNKFTRALGFSFINFSIVAVSLLGCKRFVSSANC